tara:strand:- start:4 stop:234 length:231 start_codon:yes stop_codon:yes gene_type:complete
MKHLYKINKDETGVIANLDNRNDSKLRLAEMGLMPGIEVRMIKKTPFGGPVQIKINNYYLTLRKEDAELIFLEDIK